MYLKNILVLIVFNLFAAGVLCAQSKDTTEKFMSFIPSIGYNYGNFKFKDVEQHKIPGYQIGLAGLINNKKLQFGMYFTFSQYQTFSGGNMYYHNMSVANPNFGYYKGSIAINHWTYGTMCAYRFYNLKKFDLAGQLGCGLFGTRNSIDSYNISSIGISMIPAFQINYRVNNNIKIGSLCFVNYSLSHVSNLNTVGASLQLILEVH